jgi:Calcineurin-like phosphoesterase
VGCDCNERVLVIGDVHGHRETLQRLLRGAGLLDREAVWTGGRAIVVVLGDMVDSGPDGLGVLDLLIDLQSQAAAAGGRVHAVLGNHEVQLLAAFRFGSAARATGEQTFLEYWSKYGGRASDLEGLTESHIRWIEGLPAMVRVGTDLMVHADSAVYVNYGADLDSLNARVTSVLVSGDAAAYDRFITALVTRHAFDGDDGDAQLAELFERFSGKRVIHGHTPIAKLTGQPPESVTGPLVYAGGRAVNVDHGLYLGGPGFVFDTRSGERLK